jgi:hypothetical protein
MENYMRIMILAMGRTGHHAILQWIINGLEGKVKVKHNCRNGWDEGKLIPNKTRYHKRDQDKEHEIYTIEDFHLPLWDKIKDFERFDRVIIIVRSPRNWLASSIACEGHANDFLDEAPKGLPELPVSRIGAYKEYLKMSEIWHDAIVFTPINYDRWYDKKYTKRTYATLINIENVPTPEQCKFSSFKRPFKHTEDRSEHLNKKQKRRFQRLYDKDLQHYQEMFWKK